MYCIRKNNLSLAFFIALVIFSIQSFAQVTANFTASPVNGCVPVVVTFTDQSTGSPTNWSWDFGDGSALTTLQNPGHAYLIPGQYTVTLTASNSTSSDVEVKTNFITVYAKPGADFILSTDTACAGQTVTFTDASTIFPSGSAIVSWDWDFGDGTAQSGVATNSITHSYAAAGSHAISVIVHDLNGCSGTITHTIVVVASPTPAFTASSVFKCTPPFNVTFTNSSITSGLTTFIWNFGDGTSSNQTSPTHTYNAAGTYNVTLIINQNGCIDSLVKPNLITIQDIAVSFTAAPLSLCTGQTVSFTNTSSPAAVSASWNFGDAGTSVAINPTHTYVTAGTFNVTLSSTDAKGCTGNSLGTITVNQTPVVAFTADTMVACSAPFTVNFTDGSVGAGTYHWNFGDGNSSVSQNPAHTYNAPGSYNVTLTVTNATGTCIDSLVKSNFIKIAPPVASFTSAPDSGCVSLNVNFTSTSTSTIDPISTFTWTYGDGNSSTGAASTSSNSYAAAGIFTPSLIIQTVNGCKDTAVCNNCVRAGVTPTANFTVDKDTICYGSIVTFTDASVGATSWHYIFGDGGTSNLQNPTHMYADTGHYQIKLVVLNNGCPDTSTILTELVLPPKALFTFSTSCTTYFNVQFNSTSEGADSLVWDFGDGVINSANVINPTHTYLVKGPKTITLTAYNHATGCSNTITHNLTVAIPIASFTASSHSGCYPFTPSFNSSTSQDAVSYLWNFGNTLVLNDTSIVANPSYTYTVPGKDIISLTVTDINGCKNTIKDSILALGPVPLFNASTVKGCAPLPITFTDASLSDSTLVQWTWNFGDGTIITTATHPVTHVYTTPGIYSVTMTVKDTNGCSKTIVKNNFVHPTFPHPAFTVDTFACKGQVLTYNASATSAFGPTYIWNYGDGTIDSTHNSSVTHAYASDNLYTVSLTVRDTNGCDSTIISHVLIQKPVANFGWTVINSGCGTMQVAFHDSSAAFVNGWAWDFGNGANSTLQNPLYTYTQPGAYNVTLIATNQGGCTDTLIQNGIIIVPGPVGTFTFTPTTSCNPLTATFVASSLNAQTYTWDFGDGTVMMNANDTITYTYNQTGVFNPICILGNTTSTGSPCLLPATNLTGNVNSTNVINISLTLPTPITLAQDSTAIITATAGGGAFPYTYSWAPNSNIDCNTCSTITVSGSGSTMSYILTVHDKNGCQDFDTLVVISTPCVDNSTIPNIFTPNFDGRNDVFYIPGVCATDTYSLDIYDRWGLLMFTTTLRKNSWDGRTTSGIEAAEGFYYYVIKVSDQTFKGFVQLVR